jgi:hypothetical protein
LAAAQQNIQDDGSIATGELLKGLIVKRMRSPATRPQYRVGVDPDSPARSQAHLLEFDTAPHINAGKFAGSQHPGTKGTRFMTRAYEATKQEAVAIFGRVFGPAVEKQAARLAARAAKKAQG